jgi:hypothetical protein
MAEAILENAVAWRPDAKTRERAQLTRFLADCGLDSYPEPDKGLGRCFQPLEPACGQAGIGRMILTTKEHDDGNVEAGQTVERYIAKAGP